MGIGQVRALFAEVRDAVLKECIDLETALRVATRNPADIFKLKGKGRILPSFDADLLLVDRASFEIETVIARGRIMMKDRQLRVAGTFET